MVELKVAMGSYHIIDGEKVSIRYGGQEWTCARCQQFKRDCPGKAVAKECTAVRNKKGQVPTEKGVYKHQFIGENLCPIFVLLFSL